MKLRSLVLMSMLCAKSALAIDVAPLWDYSNPALSEQRFRAALATAVGDDRLILQTQIARTLVFRKQFDAARAVLREMAPALADAGPEALTRYHLELGRSYASGQHPENSVSDADRRRARAAYDAALAAARAARLDRLAIDAIHMFVFVDTAPDQQLQWSRAALAMVLASTQADAKLWESTIRGNMGHSLHQLGRYDEALAEFQLAAALRKRGGNAGALRSAEWSVAWTLRALGRSDEALAIQLRLEQESGAAGAPERKVFEELELLVRSRGQPERAAQYAALREALGNN